VVVFDSLEEPRRRDQRGQISLKKTKNPDTDWIYRQIKRKNPKNSKKIDF
jgi:hypothetical protein